MLITLLFLGVLLDIFALYVRGETAGTGKMQLTRLSLSNPVALEDALFGMTYEQLGQADIPTLGYDEKGSGGIAATVLIDSFVLRYRTVLSSVADTEISNKVKVTTDVITKEDNTSYRHQFYAGIFGSVNVGGIAFIKAAASIRWIPTEM